MEMKNLLQETLEVLKDHGKDEACVLWVGMEDAACSWERFKEIASVNYNSDYGRQEISSELVVVGNDFWLDRRQYDGSEWWAFNALAPMPDNPRPLTKADLFTKGLRWSP